MWLTVSTAMASLSGGSMVYGDVLMLGCGLEVRVVRAWAVGGLRWWWLDQF